MDGSLGAPAGTMDTKPGINSGNEIVPPQAQPTGATPSAGAMPSPSQDSSGGLFSGLLLGIVAYLLFQNREKLLALMGQLPLLNKPKQ